jgi:hypothetical protein
MFLGRDVVSPSLEVIDMDSVAHNEAMFSPTRIFPPSQPMTLIPPFVKTTQKN